MANRKKANARRAYVSKPLFKNYAPSTVGTPVKYIKKINRKVVQRYLNKKEKIIHITAHPNSRRGLVTPTNVQGYIPPYYCQYIWGNDRTMPCKKISNPNNHATKLKTIDMWHGYVRKAWRRLDETVAPEVFNHFCGYRGLKGLKEDGHYTQQGSIIAEPMVKNNVDIVVGAATVNNDGSHNADVMRLRPHRLLGYTEVYTILALNQTIPVGFTSPPDTKILSSEKPIAMIGLRKPYDIFGKEIQFTGNVLNYTLESNFKAYCFIRKSIPNLSYGDRIEDNSNAYTWETIAEQQITGTGKFNIRADKSNFPLPTSDKIGEDFEVKLKTTYGVQKAVVTKNESLKKFELVHPNGDPITEQNYIIWVGFRIEGAQSIKGTSPDIQYGGYIDVCADI